MLRTGAILPIQFAATHSYISFSSLLCIHSSPPPFIKIQKVPPKISYTFLI
ncbi:hypothetical protein BVRB_9g208090 [Beta vulgaris subsp. vulgaris]|nr:hypothetical protein BVRB_9g208090 [Beta vulgaris subsp. vulgaris]